MIPPTQMKWIARSEQVYAMLLALYPAPFRNEYGHSMRQLFRDQCHGAYSSGGSIGLAGWWASTLFDLIETVLIERRKLEFSMWQSRLVQWAGWLFIFGGIFFAVSSISQLQPGSHYTFTGIYQLAIYALVPGMTFIALGLLGILLRFNVQINLFGRLSLFTALIGAVVMAFSWLLTLLGNDSYRIFLIGWLIHIAGHSVFGGFATVTHLLPRWNFALLIGSALPLTLVILSFSRQQESLGTDWGAFLMLLLIGVGWMWTGLTLQNRTTSSVQLMTTG
ncbi:MAG: hypothetical protein R3E39_25930 [Anaerolineae bacterium]